MQITTIYHLLKNQLSYSPREYIDVRSKSQQKLAVKYKKRQTMFDVIQKQSSKLPGPGKYVVNPQDQKLHKKIIKKINFQQQAKKPSNNFIAQELKKKKGIPGIGKYQIEHDNSQKIKLRYEVLSKKARKEAPIFRPTIFYDNQVDCINVGPGTYNTEVLKKNASLRNMPEYKPVNASDEKEKEKGKTKRSQSLPKLPTPQTYNPIPAQYNTFDAMQSRNVEEHSKSLMGKKKRFSAVRELGPGPKYSLIANWSPKNKQGKQVINIFKSTKNTKAPSVYH